MITITIDKVEYRIGKLDALKQFHVSRRLAPLLAEMGISLTMLSKGAGTGIDDFLPILGRIGEMMAKMTDADSNFIIFTSLGVVDIKQGDKFAPVAVGGNLMFQDMSMTTMLRLVGETLKDNLGGFLMGLDVEKSSPSP